MQADEINKKNVLDLANVCTGCGFCTTICPTEAISLDEDGEGFLTPSVDDQKCIYCGKCYEKCILLENVDDKKTVKCVYAAFSNDSSIRANSSSGGIFTELAKVVLEKFHGIVIGAAYQNDFTIKHELIDNFKDIPKLQQSKYVQSDISDIYKEIEKIADDVMIMFTGTPCQVAAFHEYMKARKNMVIYVDFICRGVNSPGVFLKYLNELEDRNNSKISKIWFKNKEDGWNNYHTRIDFENGMVYRENRYNDSFMRGFLKRNLYMRKACHECLFRGEKRIADITLADFWSVELNNVDIEGGVSAVLIHSDMAEKLFSMVENNIYCEEKTLEDVRKGNACIDISVRIGERREEFYSRLKTENFSDIIRSMEE